MAETYTNGNWVVKQGEEEAFVAAWREFVGWAAQHDGSGTFRLVRDVDDPRRYTSFAPWESFEAQQAWKAEPEFRDRIGRVRRHCDEFTPSVLELVTIVG
jgi:heme-degrading monooxygenase HmoA